MERPAIAKLNPGVNLPDKAIAPVHRSDGSGTTFMFTDYLSKVEPGVEAEGRRRTPRSVPGRHRRQGQRGRGSAGGRTDGAIGYVEYAYALQNKMAYAQMKNQRRQVRGAGNQGFQAAAADADWTARRVSA